MSRAPVIGHLGRKLVLSWLALGTGLLSGMVLLRLQLQALGAARLGTWMAISGVCAYLALLELGLGAALNRHVATALASERPRAEATLFVTALCLYGAMALLALIGGAALSLVLAPLLRVPPALRAETRFLPALLALDIAVTLLCGALRALLNGRGRSEVTSAVTLIRHLLYSALTVLALRRGAGLWALALVLLLADLWVGVALLIATLWPRRLRLRGARPSAGVARALLAISGAASLAYAGQLLLRQTALPMLARLLGPEVVVGYAAAGRLALVFLMLMTHTGTVLTPLMAAALARGQLSPGQALHRAGRLGLAVGAPPLLALLCLAGPLLTAWLGPALRAQATILHLMGLGMGAQLVGLGGDVMNYASGGQVRYGLLKLLTGCAAVLAIYAGARLGQARGAALGNALMVALCDAVLAPLAVCAALGRDVTLRGYYRALLTRGLALWALLPLGLLLGRAGLHTLPRLISGGGLATLCGWAVLYGCYLDPAERALLRGRSSSC